jgi:F-type H+-transporting ATPase subunit b
MIPVVGAALADSYLIWWGAQVVALAIIVWLILRWRPKFLRGRTIGQTLNDTLQVREDQIRAQLQAADESRKEAARIREEAAKDIAQARAEADDIINRARVAAEAIQREMQEGARAEYARIVGQARDEIDYERRQAEAALRRRAADIVVDAAAQVVQRYLEPSTDLRLIEESLSDLTELR